MLAAPVKREEGAEVEAEAEAESPVAERVKEEWPTPVEVSEPEYME